MKRLSLVVPTYNENEIERWLGLLDPIIQPFDSEVILVDDSEPTARVDGVRVLAGTKRGKGDAVRIGMLAAEGNVVFHLDADVEEEKLRLIPEFVRLVEEEGYDVVIAERRERLQYRSFARFFLSIGLFLAQRFFIFQSTRFFDTQCGLKAFRRDVAQKLASMQTVRGGMYDIEYLYIAVKQRMRIAQVPVSPMRELRPSRLRVLRCLAVDPFDLVRVKWNGIRGRYTR